jgi:hypothetical protein
MGEEIALSSSDAWLLHAILLSLNRGEATLEDVVGTADMLNHAMLTFEELDGGAARLTHANLVTVVAKRLRPTAKALDLVVGVSEMAPRVAARRLRAALGIPEPRWPPTPTDVGSKMTSGAFTLDDLVRAGEAHRKRVSAILSGIRRPR